MNTIALYRANVTLAGRTIFAWESFWPIPTRTDVLAPGRVRRVIGGNYPIVVNLPEGARLVSEAKPFHRLTPTEKGVVSEEIGERRTFAFGGLSLGAADVYRRAMAGLDGFAIVSGVEDQHRAAAGAPTQVDATPAGPESAPATVEYPVYSAPREVRDPTSGKLVNRFDEWSWYPIAPAEWVAPHSGYRHTQADALSPTYLVAVPATAEMVDRLDQGVRTLRLSPDDPPPWLDPDDLVRLALAGERGLRARRVAPDTTPAAAAPLFTEAFAEVSRRKIGGGSKTIGADQITWSGTFEGVRVELRTTIRANNPDSTFLTHSNARISYGMTSQVLADDQHIDVEVLSGDLDDPQLARLGTYIVAADAAGRTACVRRKGDPARTGIVTEPTPEPKPASPPPAPAPTPQPRRVARRSKASAGQLSFNW